MRSIASRLIAFGPLVGLVTAVTACEFVPDREFAALQHSLSLRIVSAKRGGSNDKVDVGFTLTNQGKTDAKACLGPSRSVSYRVGPVGGTNSDFVDHAGCAREFTIQPGRVSSWDETLEVPRLSQHPVEVEVGVQIINPQRCGSWGNCAEFELKSNTFTVP